ncbi:MAG: DUF5344 family protein [Blautia sp.]|nr:DUF5344 family protein [Lachnoclostridium sp.]MCM1212675.1 DUF5344 family protein [Blautia sp.]
MPKKILLDAPGIKGQGMRLKEAAENLEPEIKENEPRSELEVLNRYLRNYRELSALLGQYAALAKEDAGYIQDAAEKLADVDRNLLQ